MPAPYISPDGYHKLETEYSDLWKRRAKVVAALSDAAAEGDRSENAEYIYRKKELRHLDSRIRYLQNRLKELQIVNEINDKDHVYFGAWVTLEDNSGQTIVKRIVGYDELDNHHNFISIDSPMAQSLLKKSVNEIIKYSIKNTNFTYKIICITYP